MEKYPPYQSIFSKLSYGESQMLDKAFYEEEVKRLCLSFEQQVCFPRAWFLNIFRRIWIITGYFILYFCIYIHNGVANIPFVTWLCSFQQFLNGKLISSFGLRSSIMLYSLLTWGWESRRSGTWCGYLNALRRTRSRECTIALFSYFSKSNHHIFYVSFCLHSSPWLMWVAESIRSYFQQ